MKTTINGFEVLFDREDLFTLMEYPWRPYRAKHDLVYLKCTPYSKDGPKTLAFHRIVSGATKGCFVDHANGNTLDNRRVNLRICSMAENNRNKRSNRKGSIAGYKGVSYVPQAYKDKPWQASIQVDKKRISLGYYADPKSAHDAYCVASEKYHGEFGRTE